MKRAAVAGFAAGIAMAIGGALAAVSPAEIHAAPDTDAGVMNPMVGGQAMLPDRDIMDNMAASPMHTTLTTALKDSGVAGALKTNAQFTVFAPTNAAFAAAGGQPRATLARRMSYLIVPGKYDSAALLRVINESGGEARLRTAEGGIVTVRMNGPTNIVLMDEKGDTADIAIYDIHDRNGVIQVIDRVIEPGGPSRQMAAN